MTTTIGGFDVPQQLTSCKAATTTANSGDQFLTIHRVSPLFA